MKGLFKNKNDTAKEKAKQQRKALMLDIDYELTNLHEAIQKNDEVERKKANERLKALHLELNWRDFYRK